MSKYYTGKFRPKSPKKYRGDIDNITFRSSWEYRVLKFLDEQNSILEYSSEETIIHYVSPVDNAKHRYFPDFYVKFKDKNGFIKEQLWEVKPLKQSIEPDIQTKITKKYVNEVVTYGINKAKWEAAEEYCIKKGWEFKVLTENDLFG